MFGKYHFAPRGTRFWDWKGGELLRLHVDAVCGWGLLVQPRDAHAVDYTITRAAARVLLSDALPFALYNKPGIVLWGSPVDFEAKQVEGYSPYLLRDSYLIEDLCAADCVLWVCTPGVTSCFVRDKEPEIVRALMRLAKGSIG